MPIQEIEAKSLLRKLKRIDSWFLSRFGMNIYRGCAHDCAYCDGRAEKYQVNGRFGQDVAAKINAPELIRRELAPTHRRKPLPRSYLFVGGGVGDAYQAAERHYQLTRRVLGVIAEHDFPVHILTKSTLVERDLDLLREINARSRVIVSTSLSSAFDPVSRIFEPGCPPPSQRLRLLERFKQAGLATGIYLMPVIPYVTDTIERLDSTLRAVQAAGVDFVLFGGLTLKEGRQRMHFLRVLGEHFPAHLAKYDSLYPGSPWGEARASYYAALERAFAELARARGITIRLPPELYVDFLGDKERVVVELESIDYLLRLAGRRSSFGVAARSVLALEDGESLRTPSGALRPFRGAGPSMTALIEEILDHGTSSYYRKLLAMSAEG